MLSLAKINFHRQTHSCGNEEDGGIKKRKKDTGKLNGVFQSKTLIFHFFSLGFFVVDK